MMESLYGRRKTVSLGGIYFIFLGAVFASGGVAFGGHTFCPLLSTPVVNTVCRFFLPTPILLVLSANNVIQELDSLN